MRTRISSTASRLFEIIRNHKWKFFGTWVVILIVGFIAYSNRSTAPQTAEFFTQPIARGTLQRTTTSSGNVKASAIFIGGFTVEGNVTAVYVSPGDKVSAGQALMDVDVSAALLEYRQAELALKQAQAARQSVYDFGGDTMSRESADISLEVANQAFNKASKKLQGTTIKSPISGTVMLVNHKVGDKVSATPSINYDNEQARSAAAVVVMGTTNLEVTLQISDAEISEIKTGQKAIVGFSSYPFSFEGSVTKVDQLGTQQNSVFFYNVTVSFTQPAEDVKVGMVADVTLVLEEKEDVLMVPQSAVNFDENGTYVEVATEPVGGFIKKYVTTGISNETDIEILGGVNEGDVVKVSLGGSNNSFGPGIGKPVDVSSEGGAVVKRIGG